MSRQCEAIYLSHAPPVSDWLPVAPAAASWSSPVAAPSQPSLTASVAALIQGRVYNTHMYTTNSTVCRLLVHL